MTRKKKCNSESNSFVAAAEQVCLQTVLEHRQRRGRRNIAWQAIPHFCSSNRKRTTSAPIDTYRRRARICSVSEVTTLRRYTNLFIIIIIIIMLDTRCTARQPWHSNISLQHNLSNVLRMLSTTLWSGRPIR